MMMKKCLTVYVLFFLFLQRPMAQEPGIQFIENKPWKEILSASAAQNKLIFLDCYTTWCGPCKAMAKDVFPLPEVGAFMNGRFINVKQDMEKGEGVELNKKYKKYIPGYPTYLLLNAQGDVVHQVSGYNAADKFIAKIQDGLQSRSWVALSTRYDQGERGWPFIQTYLEVLEDAFQKEKIKQVTDEALPRLSIAVLTEEPAAYKVFRKYWSDAENSLLASVLSSPALYRKNKDVEKDINEWGGRLYKRAVDKYVAASMTGGPGYDTAKAGALLATVRTLYVSGRENMIALMLISKAVTGGKGDEFVRLSGAADDFGLLKNDKRALSGWAKHLAENTNDKEKLQSYLACVKLKESDPFIGAPEIRNYAFILQKMGDKTKAAEYYAKADKTEAALKEKYQAFFNNK